MRTALALLASLLLAACGSGGPPVPDWKSDSANLVERYKRHALKGENTLAEKYFGEAVAAIMEAVAGPAAHEGVDGPGRSRSKPMSPFQKLLVLLAVVGFLILFVTNPSLALWLLFSILSGGRGGGGGGGFRGGGGRSGGGGASGSW